LGAVVVGGGMEGKKRGDRFRGGLAINRCSGASVFPFLLADFIHSLPLLRLGKEIFCFLGGE
jgi:hypothetical protein